MIEDTSHHHDEYDDDSDDYFDDEMDEYCENGNGNPMEGVNFGDFQDVLQKVSDKLGLSPEEVLNKIISGKKL